MASANGVTLHGGWHSPFVKRVQIALKMKGVNTYDYVEQDLKDKSPKFLEINPKGTVPVLVHDGKIIVESLDIIKHIDEAFPGPSIFSEDDNEKSELLSWMDSFDKEVLFPSWFVFWKEGEEGKKVKEEAIKGLKKLEEQIKGKKFFGGDNIGILDVTVDFFAYGIPILEELTKVKLLTEDEFPCLLKWVSNYCNDPFVEEYFPVDDPLAKEYFPPKGPLSASYKAGLQSRPPKDRFAFYKSAFLESENRRPN
ncbi:hypothetical protein ACS0TY_016061 [Phlomoides rotata]